MPGFLSKQQPNQMLYLSSHFGFIDDYWLTAYCLLKIIPEMKTFMINLLNKKNNLKKTLFQTGDFVYGDTWKKKLPDLGMVFKPSLKCLIS